MFYGKHPITLLLQAAGYVIQRVPPLAQKDFQRIAFGHLCKSQFGADEGHGAVFPGNVKYMVHLFVFGVVIQIRSAPLGKVSEKWPLPGHPPLHG